MPEGCFPLQPYRSKSGKTNDMDTIEYATFRYDTVEVENGLNSKTIFLMACRKKVSRNYETYRRITCAAKMSTNLPGNIVVSATMFPEVAKQGKH